MQSFRNSRQFRTLHVSVISSYVTAVDNHQNVFQVHHSTTKIAVLFPRTIHLMQYNKLILRKK